MNSLTVSCISWPVLSSGLFSSLLSSFSVLASFSLVKTKGEIAVVYVEGLWEGQCHCLKFKFHNYHTTEYVSTCNSHKISSYFVTLLCTVMFSKG